MVIVGTVCQIRDAGVARRRGSQSGSTKTMRETQFGVAGRKCSLEKGYQQRRVLARGERRRWLGLVVGAADFGPEKHQEDDAVLKEVETGSKKGRRWLSKVRCPWKKRRTGNWQWWHGPSVVGGR
jgi:hypothetical protein